MTTRHSPAYPKPKPAPAVCLTIIGTEGLLPVLRGQPTNILIECLARIAPINVVAFLAWAKRIGNGVALSSPQHPIHAAAASDPDTPFRYLHETMTALAVACDKHTQCTGQWGLLLAHEAFARLPNPDVAGIARQFFNVARDGLTKDEYARVMAKLAPAPVPANERRAAYEEIAEQMLHTPQMAGLRDPLDRLLFEAALVESGEPKSALKVPRGMIQNAMDAAVLFGARRDDLECLFDAWTRTYGGPRINVI